MLFLAIYLCGVSALAAPNDSITVPTTPQSEPAAPSTPEEEQRLKSMEITLPPPSDQPMSLREQAKDRENKPFYYHYKKSISPRVGFVFDPDKLRTNFEMVFLFGFIFMLPSESANHWEVGFDIHTGGIGYLQLNRRWIFTSTERLRPFLRAGVSSRLKSEQGFASVVNQENIQLRVGFGFEDLIINPLSAAVGMDLAFGSEQALLAVLLGYSWAW